MPVHPPRIHAAPTERRLDALVMRTVTLAFVALIGAASLLSLVPAPSTTGAASPALAPLAQGAGSPWVKAVDGLPGDNVGDIAFVGDPNRNFRYYMMESIEFGLHRSLISLEGWRRMAPNPAAPQTTRVRSVAVARDDIDGLRVYAGLQARPLFGISEDAGASWRSEIGPPGVSRADLLDVTTDGTIWLAQNAATDLWHSEDRGQNWAIDANPTARRDPIDDLFASPDEARIWMVAGGRIWRSEDSPGAWQDVLGPLIAAPITMTLTVEFASIDKDGRLWAVGKRLGQPAAQVSLDDGTTWMPAAWPADTLGAKATALHAGRAGFGIPAAWLAVDDGFDGARVFETRNDGASWSEVFRAPIAVSVIAVDPVMYDVFVGTDGLGLYRLDQPPVHTGAVSAEMLAVAAPTYGQDDTVLALGQVTPLLGTQPGTTPAWKLVYRSRDGGESWARRYVTTGLGTRLDPSPAFASDRRLYSGRFLSTDSGQRWRLLAPRPGGGDVPYVQAVGPITGSRPSLYALDVPFVAGGSGTGAGLQFSGDGGASWQSTDATVDGITAIAISPGFADDATAFFVTDRGKVFRTQDATSFEEIGRLPLLAGQGAVPGLAVSPSFDRDGTLAAAVDNRAAVQRSTIYVSNNGGRTWDERAAGLAPRGRPSALILSPRFEFDRIMFLGTGRERGDVLEPAIYASDSAGAEWFGEALLGEGAVQAFAWGGLADDGRLFAATGREGLYYRDTDGGPIVPVLPTVTASPTPAPATATPTRTASPVVTAFPSPTPTPELQTLCVEAVADTHAQETRPGISAGLENELLIWDDDIETAHTYLRFEPPLLPVGSQTVTATIEVWLRAQQNEGAAPSAEMRSVAEPWTESRMTWNNKPRLGNSIATSVVDSRPAWQVWNIGPLAATWAGDPSRNHGVALLPVTGASDAMRVKLASRENSSDPAPRLCLRYRAPRVEPTATETPEPSQTPSPTALPTDGPSPTPSETPEPSSTPLPTPTDAATSTSTSTPSPTATPVPTATPTLTATPDHGDGFVFIPFVVKGR